MFLPQKEIDQYIDIIKKMSNFLQIEEYYDEEEVYKWYIEGDVVKSLENYIIETEMFECSNYSDLIEKSGYECDLSIGWDTELLFCYFVLGKENFTKEQVVHSLNSLCFDAYFNNEVTYGFEDLDFGDHSLFLDEMEIFTSFLQKTVISLQQKFDFSKEDIQPLIKDIEKVLQYRAADFLKEAGKIDSYLYFDKEAAIQVFEKYKDRLFDIDDVFITTRIDCDSTVSDIAKMINSMMDIGMDKEGFFDIMDTLTNNEFGELSEDLVSLGKQMEKEFIDIRNDHYQYREYMDYCKRMDQCFSILEDFDIDTNFVEEIEELTEDEFEI